MATEKRLIDANWILGEIEHDVGCYEIGKLTEDDALYVELRDVVKMVCAAPTVDAVEVVHGRWIDGYAMQDGKEVYKSIDCSHCNEIFKTDDREYWKARFKVCPFCGAKMDGGDSNDER